MKCLESVLGFNVANIIQIFEEQQCLKQLPILAMVYPVNSKRMVMKHIQFTNVVDQWSIMPVVINKIVL